MERKLLLLLLLQYQPVMAQKDSSASPLKISGYLETYYCYDFANPASHIRPAFTFSHNRHNEVNLNLGLLRLTYEKENVKVNLALASGTYMNANLAAEPGVLKNIYEASVAVKLSEQKNLWLEAGTFGSHIGSEGAVGSDYWTLTRSIQADNSPYFETGVKLSYTSEEGRWFISGLILNGWQRIQRVNGNNSLSIGHQLTYKPTERVTFNSSSFIGSDQPDSLKRMRYFHNLYGMFRLNNRLALLAGFDIGAEQTAKGSNRYHTWYSPLLIGRFTPNAKNSFAVRWEYYADPKGVIVPTGTPNGFRTWGYSVNYDRAIRKNVLWRMEARGFNGKDATFFKEGRAIRTNFFITTSLAVNL